MRGFPEAASAVCEFSCGEGQTLDADFVIYTLNMSHCLGSFITQDQEILGFRSRVTPI